MGVVALPMPASSPAHSARIRVFISFSIFHFAPEFLACCKREERRNGTPIVPGTAISIRRRVVCMGNIGAELTSASDAGRMGEDGGGQISQQENEDAEAICHSPFGSIASRQNNGKNMHISGYQLLR